MKISLFGQTKDKFIKILDIDNELWNQNIIENTEEKKFDANCRLLEENQVFFINYEDEDIDDGFINTTNANSIKKDDFSNLKVIYYKLGDLIYFQRILPSFLITSTWLTFVDTGKKGVKIDTNPRLKFENRTDIILDTKNKKIYFKVFNDLEKVFPNFYKYYREASEEEFDKFKTNELLKVNLDFKDLGKRQLKKIAQIMNKEENKIDYFENNIEAYEKYAKDYGINFETFEINTKDQIDQFHALVFEYFYKTPISDEKRMSNSHIKI